MLGRTVVAAALLGSALAGGAVAAGLATYAAPLSDDAPVSRTYVRSTMYVDPAASPDVAFARAGGCLIATAVDDSCA